MKTTNSKHLWLNYSAFTFWVAIALIMSTAMSLKATPTLTLASTINGDQVGPTNDFGVAGTIDGLAAGTYGFSLTRTPHNFTTSNLQLGVSGSFWSNYGSPHYMFIDNGPHAFNISGIIPYGVECGEYETVVLNIYNSSAQLVISKTITIKNPTHPAPQPNFKINGNSAMLPTAIVINNDITPNITMSYTGTGVVTRYRLYLQKASSTGVPISGGTMSDVSWHNGSVPATVNIRLLTGGSFGSNELVTHPGYYLLILETEGGLCAYDGAAPRKALIMTKNTIVKLNTVTKQN